VPEEEEGEEEEEKKEGEAQGFKQFWATRIQCAAHNLFLWHAFWLLYFSKLSTS
jgi:hypothetical protein